MINSFIKLFSESGVEYDSSKCKGYSVESFDGIKRLYNIEITGQLSVFLSEVGMSDGGIIGDSYIPLYRPTWRVREHLLFQVAFLEQMQEAGYYTWLGKPFVFAIISETQYYFLQTSPNPNDTVYHFDSNSCVMQATEWDLIGFFRKLIEWAGDEMKLSTTSDLLRI